MKFDTQKELQAFFEKCPNAENVVRDDAGRVVSFCYQNHYNNHSHRLVSVSLRRQMQVGKKTIQLCDADFFKRLDENYTRVTSVKKTREKITQYKLDGVKYVAEAPPGVGLWDIFPYKKFLRYTKSRFYGVDKILRNGYFPGLIGSSTHNISKYQAAPDKYNVYDVDINNAYPALWNMLLPYGAFYDEKQWDKLTPKPDTYMCFYHIKLRSIDTDIVSFSALPAYWEYRDFDFLAHKTEYECIVSEYRLHLINIIYGALAYEIVKVFRVATKIYAGIRLWRDEQIAKIHADKLAGKEYKSRKTAINMLVGMFGKQDGQRDGCRVEKVHNNFGDVFVVVHDEFVDKKCNNYLPLAMTIVDMCAVSLFYTLVYTPGVMPLSWNTDGAVIAVPRGVGVVNSDKMGELKSKLLDAPLSFYDCPYTYGRPLIVDAHGDVYNSNCIYFDNNKLCMEVTSSINTPKGFKTIIHEVPIPPDRWNGFNLREEETRMKLFTSRKLNDLKSRKFFGDEIRRQYNMLSFPYDQSYNIVRHTNTALSPQKYEFLLKKILLND